MFMIERIKMKNKKIDWQIHAVYDSNNSNKPIDIHTHGLEKHKIRNICMNCPDKSLINYCGNFINKIALSMIDGEIYTINKIQYIDNKNDYNEIYDVFDLTTDVRDNGVGEEEVYVIDYWFEREIENIYNHYNYFFDKNKLEWVRK